MSAAPTNGHKAVRDPFDSASFDATRSPFSVSSASISPPTTPAPFPYSRAISTDTTASAASSALSLASSASSASSASASLSAEPAAAASSLVEPAIVLQAETGLRAPPPNKSDAYLFFHSATTPPPGTLRTHPHAALPPTRRLATLSCPHTAGPGSGGAECTRRCRQAESIAAVDLDGLRSALLKRREADVDDWLRLLCGVVQREQRVVLGGDNPLLRRLMEFDAACGRDKLLPLLLSHLSAASQAHISASALTPPTNHAALSSTTAVSTPQFTDTPAAHSTLHLAYLFSYLTTGSPAQCQHLIGVGIVPHLTHLLAHSLPHNARTTECALTALGNLSADPSCRSVVVLSGVTDVLMGLLIIRRRREHEFHPHCMCIDCRSLPSRRLCMWILSLLARSMCSSSSPHSYNALSPLVQPLCAMTEVEADADLCLHLLFFLYSATTSTPGAYHFPLSPSHQSHHAQLCSLLPLSVLPLLVTTLSHDEANLAYAALCILSNLAFASLPLLAHLIESTRLVQQLTAVWTQLAGQSLTDISLLQRTQLNFVVSCLAASPLQHHMVLLLADTRLVDAMVLDLSSSLLPISRGAAWAVANLTRGWWSISRKDRDGQFSLNEDGGRVMAETRERRRLLADKAGLMRGLCALLSVEYEDDVEHAELLHVALVAVSNLLSDEWWVHDLVRKEGLVGLEKAEAIRQSNRRALEQAPGSCSSPSLHAHPHHPLPAHSTTHTATPARDNHSLPPYSCFQSSCQSYHTCSPATFPTASPNHPPASHPLTAAFLAHYGLALLSRLEHSRLWYVRRWCVWMVCLFFTEYCNRHEGHRQLEYEDVNPLDVLREKEAVDVALDGDGDGDGDGLGEDGDVGHGGSEGGCGVVGMEDADGGSGVLLDGLVRFVDGKHAVDANGSDGSGGDRNGVVHWHE